jgi:ABC-type transporter Mla MlaB component
MTLQISAIGPAAVTNLKLAGRLTAEEVPVLSRVCAELTGRVVLDLTDLHFADRQGVCLLLELRAQGAELTGVCPYLLLLLAGR